MSAHPPTQGRGGWGFLTVFGFLAAAITLLGMLYLNRQQAAARSSAHAELGTIADLKVQQLVNWRRERLADANLIRATPYFLRSALDALGQPEAPKTRQMLTGWLGSLLAVGLYERALLLDDRLNIRLACPEGSPRTLADAARRSAEEALRTRQVVMTDLHRSEQDGQAYLDFVVPLSVSREGTDDVVTAPRVDPSPADQSAGVLVLKLNAHDFLFPLIQTWPTASPTAETLLVRREGKEVLFLNELRHQKGTAMSLRRSLDEARLPAAMFWRGETGNQEGVDYRGVRVVAAVRPVPDTPWVMVAKVDAAELYAPLRREALRVILVAVVLLLASALAFTLLWRRRNELFLHIQLATERERRAAAERAEKTLRESEERFRAVVEGSAIAVFVSLDMNFTYLNPAALRLLGAETPGQLIGQPVLSRIHTDYHSSIQQRAAKVLRGQSGGAPAQEEVYLRLDGTPVPVEVTASPIIYQAQRGAVVFVQDIIVRKRAEEALRETEARIRKMLKMAPVPMCHLTRDGMIEFRNERFVRVFGYTAEDVPSLAEWWRRAYPDPQYRQWAVERWDEAVRHASAGERDTAGVDYKVTCKSGEERTFEISGIMLGEELLVTFIDVTEHKLAQETMRKFNAELEHQVRQRTAGLEAAVKELDAFTYSVSHDLRAPLRHIGGFAGLLRTSAGPSLPDKSRHYLDEITGAATQMGRLIDDLLRFSRMGRTGMHPERLELAGLIEESIHRLRPEINGRNILWQKNPLPAVQADPVLLRQVLINLFSNAIKYTRPRDPARIEIGCASENGQETVIFVRDNGVGFDMEYSNKLFGVFQRLHADEEFEGTGVGLANVRRIIARHGGRTWAEGKVNEGATFYFSLPI